MNLDAISRDKNVGGKIISMIFKYGHLSLYSPTDCLFISRNIYYTNIMKYNAIRGYTFEKDIKSLNDNAQKTLSDKSKNTRLRLDTRTAQSMYFNRKGIILNEKSKYNM